MAEMNTIMMEMEDSILTASINNQTVNTTNIGGMSEDLRYLIQSNMENWVFQIQRILADKLDIYKYVDENVQEIQDLYKENEDKKEGRMKDKEVILIKPYEVDELISMTKVQLHKWWSWEFNQVHEIYPIPHIDKDLLTTTTLSIT